MAKRKGIAEVAASSDAVFMKRVMYAGGSFISGDGIVDAVLRFAAANANANRAAEIHVPALDVDGQRETITVVVGPASQLMAETVIAPAQLDDDEFVRRIDGLTEELVGMSGVDPSPDLTIP